MFFPALMTGVMMNFTADIQLATLWFRLAMCCISVVQWPGLLRETSESLLLFSEIFYVQPLFKNLWPCNGVAITQDA